jgi:hypothetical protein
MVPIDVAVFFFFFFFFFFFDVNANSSLQLKTISELRKTLDASPAIDPTDPDAFDLEWLRDVFRSLYVRLSPYYRHWSMLT